MERDPPASLVMVKKGKRLMSNHDPARSNASKKVLGEDEIVRYNALLVLSGAALLEYPTVVRGLLEIPHRLERMFTALIPSADPHAPAHKQWEAFYQKHFGLSVDFSEVVIPAQGDGFMRLIIVAQGVTLNAVMAACKARFSTWQYYDDLDAKVTRNDRTAQNGTYAVWFRDRVEADEETANRSADQLSMAGVKSITLLERILMELEYFDRTGQHLDIRNWTLCAGSHDAGGGVPFCRWRGGTFSVRRARASNRYPDWRAREVVS